MIDRASTFANPEIIELLQQRFVAVAIDQAYQRRQQDDEGEFYRQIAKQSPRHDFNGTTQGLFVGTADGRFLGFSNHRSPERIKDMLLKALQKYQPQAFEPPVATRFDPRWNTQPPKDGLVVRVTAKVLGGYAATDDPTQQAFQQSISRDNLWVTASETKNLSNGSFPLSLAQRIARFHLVDNTRGEPPMWEPAEVRSIKMTIEGNRVQGSFHLETADGKRGFIGDVRGIVNTEGERVTRFDLVARGEFWGEGPFTRNPPPGSFPLAVSFRLADGSDEADKVRPQGSRGWIDGYLGRSP